MLKSFAITLNATASLIARQHWTNSDDLSLASTQTNPPHYPRKLLVLSNHYQKAQYAYSHPEHSNLTHIAAAFGEKLKDS